MNKGRPKNKIPSVKTSWCIPGEIMDYLKERQSKDPSKPLISQIVYEILRKDMNDHMVYGDIKPY